MTGSDDPDELGEDSPEPRCAATDAASHIMSPVGLTGQQARILDDAGFIAAPERDARAAPAASARAAQLIATALTVAQVAAALGVSRSQIRRRRAQHGLWAIDVDGRWLFPIMQFEDNPQSGDDARRQICGLDHVFQALPHDLHPASVAGFLSTAHPNLVLEDQPTAPVVWLRGGGDVAAVLDLVAAAHRVS